MAEKEKATAEAPKPVKTASYSVVADGKAITTRKGVKSGGEVVSADIISGGKAAFDRLIKSGHIVKG